MNINSTAPHQSKLYSTAPNTKTEYAEKSSVFSNEKISNTKEANLKQEDLSNVYEELSSKYNVQEATFEEIKEISKTLHEAGAISTKNHLILTFDQERATDYLKANAPMSISTKFDMYQTAAGSDGERDWIAEFKARASKDFEFGNHIGYQNNMEVLTILQKLNA